MIYLIVLLAFAIRALPRFVRRDAFVSDTYFHLYCARTIRENNMKVPEKLPDIVLYRTHSYPFGYHYLLALFSLKYMYWAERLSGAFLDSLSVVIVYLFSDWAVRNYSGGHYQHVPLLVAALYAFSPALLRVCWGPSVYNGSPRLPARMLYLLHATAALHYLATGNIASLMLSSCAAALLIVSSKFSNQALFFFGIFFTVFISVKYILLLLFSFLISAILSRGKALKVIKGQITHSVYYYKHLQKVYLFNNLRNYRLYFKAAKEAAAQAWNSRDVMKFAVWYNSERYFVHLLFLIFPQFICLALWFFSGRAEMDMIDYGLLIWTIAGFSMFLATSYKYLLFLGESERYLEHALFPSLFLMVKNLDGQHRIVIVVFLLYSMFLAALYFFYYISISKKINDDFSANEVMYEKIRELPRGIVLAIGSLHWEALYRTNFPVLFSACLDPKILPYREFCLLYSKFPYPSRHFEEIVRRYNVSYIIADKWSLKNYRRDVLKDDEKFNRLTSLLLESPGLLFYKIRGDTAEHPL